MDAPLIGPVDAPLLHVMTYNIRRPTPNLSARSPDRWSGRKGILGQLLEAERPTILGVQEAMPAQLEFVLHSLGASYQCVGRGRNINGSGEHVALFYDTERLALENWKQQALSDTPDVAGSRSWGNILPRTAVIATFTDTETDARLVVTNMHLDHLSARSRVKSAAMLARLAAASDLPVIVMGDANANAGSPPYRALTANDALRDAWLTAKERLTDDFGTFSSYRPPRRGGRRIDWILVDPGFEVPAAGINARRYDSAAPSDHEPVQVLLRLPSP